MNQALIELSKNHKMWCDIVKKFGELDQYEDIVQEMYLRFYKYGQIEECNNRFYIWKILRNIYFDKAKQDAKTRTLDIANYTYISEDENALIEVEAKNIIFDKVEKEQNSWHSFDALLFEHYKDTDKSMRKIAKDSKLPLMTVFNTIKHCKQRIRENVGEDYQDFKNKEFELL